MIGWGGVGVGVGAGVGGEAGGEALHARIAEGAAAADAVADAVVEGADAGAVEVDLAGIGTDGVVGGFADVEAFAVEIDLAAVDAVGFGREGVEGGLDVGHVVGEVQAHLIEAEAVDLVLLRVEHEGIDHELFHHAVFAGGVGAAGAGELNAVGVEAVVVVGDEFVEVGGEGLAAGAGVIEDDVLNDAQAGGVQAGDHLAVFADAVIGIDGVSAFGSHVVMRVIAPVVGVVVLHGGNGGLLLVVPSGG